MNICIKEIVNATIDNDAPIVIMSLRRANELQEAAANNQETRNQAARIHMLDKLNLNANEVEELVQTAYALFLQRPDTTKTSAKIACTALYRALTNCKLGEAIAACRELCDEN